jgi:hypothetical protein
VSGNEGDEAKLWFAARTVYEHDQPGDGLFEERIILVRAASFDEAMERAQAEAATYAEQVTCAFTGYITVFEIAEEQLSDGMEVFSVMRDSDLSAEDYIDRFYTTGDERSADDDENSDDGGDDLQS